MTQRDRDSFVIISIDWTFLECQEKGNYVIHVAASAGQMEQVELLISYGADPNVIDCHGNNVIACARYFLIFLV